MRLPRPVLLLLTLFGWAPTWAQAPGPASTAQPPVPVVPDGPSALDRLLAATQPATSPTALFDAVLMNKNATADGRTPDHLAVAAALGVADALVEFVQWRATDGERITALVVRAHGAPTRVDLGDAAVLRQAIAAHLQLMARTQRPLDAASLRLANVAARRVGTLVLQPLEPLLAGCSCVHFAPTGDLLALPLDSLPTGRADTLLVETLDVRLLHSGCELVAPLPPPNGRLMVVDGGTIDLPEASREARAVAGAWERAGRGAVLQRSGSGLATLPVDVRGQEFLHLAGSPQLLASLGSTAARPAVATRSADAVAAADAAMHRRNVAALDLASCRLVVASAIPGQAGQDALPGGITADWRAALRSAGARSSLLPAWPIDGTAARELMTEFWRELILCDDPATALRRAKLARLEANRSAHGQALPGTWAGFSLFGHASR